MEATPVFFNRVAATYGESWTIEEETRIAAAGMARALTAVGSGPGADLGPVLEVGCGNGRLLANLPRGAIGVDFSEGMLREARARLPSARLVLASALALPFRPRSLGVVIAANVVHNHADPVPVLEEIGRVTTRLIVDFRNRVNPVVCWKAWRWRSARFIRYTARTPWGWRQDLARVAWTPLERRRVPRPAVDPGTGFRWSHLVGAILSRLPGFAPVEVWLCQGVRQ